MPLQNITNRKFFTFIIAMLIWGCTGNTRINETIQPAETQNQNQSQNQSLSQKQTAALSIRPQLPSAISNNAVAIAESVEGQTLYSFLGLGAGKTYQDVQKTAFACPINKACEQLDDVPVPQGRLASVAVTIKNKIYLFGGYTVAPDGSEVSTPDVLAFDPKDKSWLPRAPMPTPVDDMVAFAHLDRYIYLVSGWHNDGNVSLTQVYDTQDNRWFQATKFPGRSVFGHSGGSVNGHIVITDGVSVLGVKEGRRQFGLINDSWYGQIDENDPALIRWRKIKSHPFGPLYRMAAIGDEKNNHIVFAGGGDNAYNYNGIGYDGILTKPSNLVFAFDLNTNTWKRLTKLPTPSMDHRGLLIAGDHYVVVGGMGENAVVRRDIIKIDR